MSLDRLKLIALIDTVFDDVPQPDDVTLHVAEAHDEYDYDHDDEHRKNDFFGRWQDVPNEHIRNCQQALSYVDKIGMRYYLPAYMTWYLNYFGSREILTDHTLYTLDNHPTDSTLSEYFNERFSLFTAKQFDVCAKFVKFCAEDTTQFTDTIFARKQYERYWSQHEDTSPVGASCSLRSRDVAFATALPKALCGWREWLLLTQSKHWSATNYAIIRHMKLTRDSRSHPPICFIAVAVLLTLGSGCGFNRDFVSSVPVQGERTSGGMKIIRRPELAISLAPRNILQTGELTYVVIVPVSSNSTEVELDRLDPGQFKIGLALFAYQYGLSLNLPEIELILDDKPYYPIEVIRHPYASYSTSQATHSGDRHILCPSHQNARFDGSLPIQPIRLENDGLWECHELVFRVDTPAPSDPFEMSISVFADKDDVPIRFDLAFVGQKWGASDSFP